MYFKSFLKVCKCNNMSPSVFSLTLFSLPPPQSLSDVLVSGGLQAHIYSSLSIPLMRSPTATDVPHMPYDFRAAGGYGKAKVRQKRVEVIFV